MEEKILAISKNAPALKKDSIAIQIPKTDFGVKAILLNLRNLVEILRDLKINIKALEFAI